MCWGVASTQINYATFGLEKGIQYQGGLLDRRSAHSILECARECTKEQSCFGFNLESHEGELLYATASGRNNNASGWTHGHKFTGKYQNIIWENPVRLDAGSKKGI